MSIHIAAFFMSSTSIIEPMDDLAQCAIDMFNIQLSPEQIRAFKIYSRELLDWNRRVNLTAIQSEFRPFERMTSDNCQQAHREKKRQLNSNNLS